MNKLIVVTGGTRGIGRAIIEKFASEGFDIATCSRSWQDLEQLKISIEKILPVHVHIYAGDMSKKDDVLSFTSFVLSLKRDIDVLVNNTGYFVPGEIITEEEGVLESMMNANLFSAYHTTRALAIGMKKKRKGYIFNMCSIASFMAYPNGGSYAITKFALLGFSKCLREELKSFDVRVSSIMPGATYTSSWDGVDLPEDRFMPPEDVAEATFAAYSLSSRTVIEEIVLRPQLGDI